MIVGVWCLIFPSGCAVGPNYARPAVNTPPAYRGDTTPANGLSADLNWWQVYDDAMLQSLIREAFTNSYDLRIAVTRVEQARAVVMQARSQFVPNVGYSGTVSRGRNDFLGSAYPENAATTSSVSATLNAFWELDLWGRIRRLNESARDQALCSLDRAEAEGCSIWRVARYLFGGLHPGTLRVRHAREGVLRESRLSLLLVSGVLRRVRLALACRTAPSM